MTAIMLMLALMVCFYKADFLNLTVCCVAIYILNNADAVTGKQDLTKWRLVIFGSVITFVYDVLWFMLRHSDLNATAKEGEGNVEVSLK